MGWTCGNKYLELPYNIFFPSYIAYCNTKLYFAVDAIYDIILRKHASDAA